MKKTLRLQGLDCAHCATKLEEELAVLDGVINVAVAFVAQKLTVEYDSDEALQRVIDTVNQFEEVRVIENEETENEGGRCETNGPCHCHEHCHGEEHEHAVKEDTHKKEWLCISLSAVLFALGFLLTRTTNGLGKIAAYLVYAAAYIVVGYPVLISTFKNIKKGNVFDENFLMTVASIGAIILGEIEEGVAVMLLYQLGETLQGIAVQNSRRSITDLMDLKSETATVLIDGKNKTVSPEEINVGDVLLVKAGEKIPVDGVLLSECATLDVKALTGEAEYRETQTGSELLSGSINVGGVFQMQATRCYDDSAVGKILDMVENAAAGKAKPEKFITKFARYYTPIVCIFALVMAIFAPLAHGLIADGTLYFKEVERWINSALTFLVISCPCALIISVPLTYFAGIGACAKQGVLVKGATYLDTLAKATVVAFDKTGTLTEGNFTVQNTTAFVGEEEEILRLAATLEKNSIHPLSKAFLTIDTPYTAKEVTEISGRGLQGKVQGSTVAVGNAELLRMLNIPFTPLKSVNTLIYVAKDSQCLGAVEVGDSVRADVKPALVQLKKMGVTHAIMLTGDNQMRAEKIANAVGMCEVKAELLPDGKVREVEKLKKVGMLVYVGDGINDAPVMAASDCAVSMGKLGSAAAVEASDLVLISDSFSSLVNGFKAARKTRGIVIQNIVFSIVMKVAFMALSFFGVLDLWLAVFADVGVMLLAVLNSLRVRILPKK